MRIPLTLIGVTRIGVTRIGVTLSTLLLAFSTTTLAQGPLTFTAGTVLRQVTFSERPSAVADFNGDGHRDVVLAGAEVFFLAGDGAGNFPIERVSPIPLVGSAVVAADFNNDGLLDLAGRSVGVTSDVAILAGDGTGLFSVIFQEPLGPGILSPAAGDFNDDGNIDLAVSFVGSSSGPEGYIGVFLGDGNGSLSPIQEIYVGPSPSISDHIADFDGDGHLDLIGSAYSPQLGSPNFWRFLLRGDGSGQFLPPVNIGAIQRPIAIADMNGDSILDLVTAVGNADKLMIDLGNGTGQFLTRLEYDTLDGPQVARPVDLDGDDDLDLILVHRSGSDNLTFQLLVNDGSGGMTAVQEFPSHGSFPLLMAEDWTGDGAIDLLVQPCDLTLFRGDGTGRLITTPTLPIESLQRPSFDLPFFLDKADFNEDGVADPIYYGLNSPQLRIMLSAPASAWTELVLPYTGRPTMADVDGDSHVDIVLDSGDTLLGNGLGGFPNAVDSPSSPQTDDVTLADLNGDNNLDLVLTREVYLESNGGILVRLGDGIGGFAPATTYTTTSQGSSRCTVADFNNDGNLDVVATSAGQVVASVALGNGDGTLQPASEFTVGFYNGHGIDHGDFNLDGNMDVVVTPELFFGDDFVRVFFGDGGGGFTLGGEYALGSGTDSVAVADLDADGDLEIIVPEDDLLSSDSCEILVLDNNGDGNFTPRGFHTGLNPRCVFAADIDLDGKLDIVAANSADNTLSFLYQLGGSSPQYRRGDCNADGSIGISDALYGLNVLFTPLGPAPCIDACDVNDDAIWGLVDMIFLLNNLFLSGSTPTAPYPECGTDPTVDMLDCETYDACP